MKFIIEIKKLYSVEAESLQDAHNAYDKNEGLEDLHTTELCDIYIENHNSNGLVICSSELNKNL